MFTFTDEVPTVKGRTYIDKARAEELIEACIDNHDTWAKVPITWLYPDLDGADEKKLTNKCRMLAGRIRAGNLAPFNDYRCEAASRGTDIFIRITLSPRQRRELTE